MHFIVNPIPHKYVVDWFALDKGGGVAETSEGAEMFVRWTMNVVKLVGEIPKQYQGG